MKCEIDLKPLRYLIDKLTKYEDKGCYAYIGVDVQNKTVNYMNYMQYYTDKGLIIWKDDKRCNNKKSKMIFTIELTKDGRHIYTRKFFKEISHKFEQRIIDISNHKLFLEPIKKAF